MSVIVCFRLDLRLDDNPSLLAAARTGEAVLPVYVWAPEEEEPWAPGAASRWWLHHSLAALADELAARGSRLLLARGPTAGALRDLARAAGAHTIYWNERVEPALAQRDWRTAESLRREGLAVRAAAEAWLVAPGQLLTTAGRPYQVFTPFWKRLQADLAPGAPQPCPARLPAPEHWPPSLALAELDLQPRPDWAAGLRAAWQPGSAAAAARLQDFLTQALAAYASARDLPAEPGTSRLSPHLHFGELSPRRLWRCLADLEAANPGALACRRQLAWREFAAYLLYHFPHTPAEPLRPDFAHFPWRCAPADLRAWQRGRTGYPPVDAALRELWHRGWMHNRGRLLAASFLTKHLRLPWQEGARWFWDTLVDADLANNTLGWQWTAGCGADAAPYFRIFNPSAQAARFDPAGTYLRRWLPELARLPDRWLAQPWTAPPAELAAAGVRLGENYPRPVVDHAAARAAALAAYASRRGSAGCGGLQGQAAAI